MKPLNKIIASNFLKNRTIAIATKHGKEKAIAPLFFDHFNVKSIVPENLDTDKFGTFTGEKVRLDDPLTTARKKCEMVMSITGLDCAISSEGSFGPHPSFFFVNADTEIVMFKDKKYNIEIYATEISTKTNFSAQELKSNKELIKFAKKSLFPSHSIILKDNEANPQIIVKDIKNEKDLKLKFNKIYSKNGCVYAETDMRAMNNPTRMKVIKIATKKLIEKIKTTCPNCDFPGFSIVDYKQGLPCSFCKFPTQSTLSYIYKCAKCNYTNEMLYPKGKFVEEPMFCDICNP